MALMEALRPIKFAAERLLGGGWAELADKVMAGVEVQPVTQPEAPKA